MLKKRLIPFLLLIFVSVFCFRLIGQDKPIKQADDHAILIAEIFEKTKLAKTANDYSTILDDAASLLKLSKLSQDNRKYLASLSAWAHDRRGLKRFELIDLLRKANNEQQAILAVQKTLDDFEKAIELDPNRWQAVLHRGALHAANEQWQKALDDFSSVLKTKQDQTSARFSRAECAYQLGRFQSALKDYDTVLEGSPGDLQAITGRAHSLLQLGQLEKALEEYNVVIKFKPESAWAYANRADAHQAKGDWHSAYKDYNRALEIEAEADIYRRVAWMLATCPDEEYYRPQTATELARKSIEIAGESSDRLDVLAACLASSGSFDEAKQMQQKAVTLCGGKNKPFEERMALYEKGEAFLQTKQR